VATRYFFLPSFCYIFKEGLAAADTEQVRMGKGKGSFDHWASRVAVSKIIFELKGDIHEQVARDAFRLAGNKMPGKFAAEYNSSTHGVQKND
jgi:ribosomal protein L16